MEAEDLGRVEAERLAKLVQRRGQSGIRKHLVHDVRDTLLLLIASDKVPYEELTA